MSLETGTRIQDLVPTNPVGATDFASQGDDHIRLIKACVQGSFPSLGATAVTASGAELNFLNGVTSAVQTQLDAKLSSAAAAAGYQPLDADLTAIAALATASFGRGLLTLANTAALADLIEGEAMTLTGQIVVGGATGPQGTPTVLKMDGTFANTPTPSTSQLKLNIGPVSATHNYGFTVGSDGSLWAVAGDSSSPVGASFSVSVDGTRVAKFTTDGILIGAPTGGTAGAGSINAETLYQGGVRAQSLPLLTSTSTTLAKGKMHHITGNATLPALGDGEWICIVNNSGSDITISEHSGDTTYWSTGQVSIATVTLQARGRLFASGAGSSVVYVSGDIGGYT